MRNSSAVNVRQVVCYLICAFNKPATLGLLERQCRGRIIRNILQHQHGTGLIFLAQQVNHLWVRARKAQPAHFQLLLERRTEFQQVDHLNNISSTRRL